jgi:two-component system sensor histidine kinase DegS
MTSPESPQPEEALRNSGNGPTPVAERAVRLSKGISAQGRRQIALFNLRLRDRRFWLIQALVVAISIVHTALEIRHSLGSKPSLYLIPVSTYFVPVMYAALNFGLEGAMPTVLWCWIVTTPNIIFLHHGAERWGVLMQLGILLAVAALVASRVDRQRQAKLRAEAASSRLSDLNAAAAAASQSLDLAQVLTSTLRIILQRGAVHTAWIVYAPDGWTSRHVAALSGWPPRPLELQEPWQRATQLVTERGAPCLETLEDGSLLPPPVAIVPIWAAENVVGALGVANPGGSSWGGDVDHLIAIARQLGLALENIRNYESATGALVELGRAQEALESYVRLATEAQEEERRRLARELHDDTIQSLVIINGYLESVGVRESAAKTQLDGAKLMLTQAIDELQRFCHDLRPSLLDDLGLVHAVEGLAVDFGARTGVEVDVAVQGPQRRLDPKTELVFYRIVQEALRNAEKHSGATRVGVTVAFASGSVAARVADDGCGFERGEVFGTLPGGDGLGLRGMEERAKLVGAVLTIESSPGKGTSIRVEAPEAL